MIQHALLIGCGGIGFRHLQSLIKFNQLKTLFIVEPDSVRSESALAELKKNNCKLSVTVVSALNRVPLEKHFDIAISAVTADIQAVIAPEITKFKISHLLLEKPVAQSKDQFIRLNELYEKANNVEKVYVNCPQNLFEGHHRLRKLLNEKRSSTDKWYMDVIGYNWGYGCNALHWLELFRFLFGGTDISCTHSDLSVDTMQNKRGSNFIDFYGTSLFVDNNGNQLQVSVLQVPDIVKRDCTIKIYEPYGESFFITDESAGKIYNLPKNQSWPLNVLLVSQSTCLFLESLETGGNLLLPEFKDITPPHLALHEALAMAFNNKNLSFT